MKVLKKNFLCIAFGAVDVQLRPSVLANQIQEYIFANDELMRGSVTCMLSVYEIKGSIDGLQSD